MALVYIVYLEASKLGLEGMERAGPATPLVKKPTNMLGGFAGTAGLAAAIYYGLGWTKEIFGDTTFYAVCAIFIVTYPGLAWHAAGIPDLEADDPDAPLTILPPAGATARTGLYFPLPLIVLIGAWFYGEALRPEVAIGAAIIITTLVFALIRERG